MFLRNFKGLKEKAAKVRFAVCLLCPLRSISVNASACFSLRLRSAAKNDAPCRFLNALVQIPVVKYRKTKTDK